MTIELPQPIDLYFRGKNSRDFAGALSAFSEAAVVSDEQNKYVARDAIRAWMEETSRKYNDKAEIQAAVTDGNTTQVTAAVSGTFPGSPAVLQFSFVVTKGLIDRLSIGT